MITDLLSVFLNITILISGVLKTADGIRHS